MHLLFSVAYSAPTSLRSAESASAAHTPEATAALSGISPASTQSFVQFQRQPRSVPPAISATVGSPVGG